MQRRQLPSSEKDARNDDVVRLLRSLAEAPFTRLAKAESLMAVIADTVDANASLKVHKHRGDGILRVAHPSEGNTCFVDDFGDVFDELPPGCPPFRRFPVVNTVLMGVAILCQWTMY